MLNISIEKKALSFIAISPMSIKRDWMDLTPEKHAYRCFPVTQANMVGWNLFATKDLSFIWNGINDTSSENIKVIEGSDFTYTGRGQSTVSFHTGIVFKTEENISMFTINPVNYFNNDFETVSSIISTSWYDRDFPLAIKAKVVNKEIFIKSGTPLATIIPISLTSLNNTDIKIVEYSDPGEKRKKDSIEYGKASQKINQSGEWTDWYRKAINEKNEKLGNHEVNVLNLSVSDRTIKNNII